MEVHVYMYMFASCIGTTTYKTTIYMECDRSLTRDDKPHFQDVRALLFLLKQLVHEYCRMQRFLRGQRSHGISGHTVCGLNVELFTKFTESIIPLVSGVHCQNMPHNIYCKMFSPSSTGYVSWLYKGIPLVVSLCLSQ